MVRKAELRDVPRIAEMIIFGKRVAYRDIFRNDAVSFNQLQVVDLARTYCREPALLDNMLVYDDGIVKGVINRRYTGDRVELFDFYVEPFFKGRGIGRQLLGRLIQEARQRGCTGVDLWVIGENAPARRFYERNGFSATGKTAPIEGTEQLDVHYALSLEP